MAAEENRSQKQPHGPFIQLNYFIPKITLRGICWVSAKLVWTSSTEGRFCPC